MNDSSRLIANTFSGLIFGVVIGALIWGPLARRYDSGFRGRRSGD